MRAAAPRPGDGPAAATTRCGSRKLAEIAACDAWGREQIGTLSDRDLLVAGAALYAGEGSKTDGAVGFANTNPRMVTLFCRWLRSFFDVDESRLRVRLYLHQGLNLADATAFWSDVTGIPRGQFTRPYRAAADSTRRHSKHTMGCATVIYGSARTHREVMGLVRGLLDADQCEPGSGGRARTGDILINSQALCQLSYPGKGAPAG